MSNTYVCTYVRTLVHTKTHTYVYTFCNIHTKATVHQYKNILMYVHTVYTPIQNTCAHTKIHVQKAIRNLQQLTHTHTTIHEHTYIHTTTHKHTYIHTTIHKHTYVHSHNNT